MNLSALSLAVVLIAGPVVAVAQSLDDSFQSLKDAEAKKDIAGVKKFAAEASKIARGVIASPAPTQAEEKDNWTKRVTYAKEVDQYTEYALYKAALGAPPETQVDLLSTLEKQNPKSKYLDEAYGTYIVALSQTGASAKVPEIAEKALPNFPDNEDLLLVLANSALGKQQTERALSYATRLTAAMNKDTKPEGMSAADWERRRSIMLGRGYWIAGLVYAAQSKFALADKSLRAALPHIKGDSSMLGEALFNLGVANYQFGKMTNSKARLLEAAKFSDEAAKIEGPRQQQAWRNAQLIKDEAARMR